MGSKMIRPLVLTLLILCLLEIFSTALFSGIGVDLRLPFSILIILYFSFKLQTVYMPLLILLVQFVHNFFSIESWEVGTISGILIYLLISYLKDLVHLTNAVLVIFFVQVFQFLWFLITSFLYYIHLGDSSYLVQRFWNFIPESLILSFVSPVLFWFLDILWKQAQGESLRESL